MSWLHLVPSGDAGSTDSASKANGWQGLISDPDEKKVFEALGGPHITWRTVSAIARQTGIPELKVWEILSKYNAQLTRLSTVPSASGSPLVGLLEKVG